MGVKDRPQCYFDVELNREPVGRIVFQLFSEICPKTSKNFLSLCTGERGTGKLTGKKLCYKGSTFHRVVKNFMIQGGDFTEGNGRGGESIFGGYFEDENFTLKHDRAFLLSMANRGKDTNGSQFFITTKTAPHLDGVHVVFGLVISGFEVIKKIEGLKTDSASRPYADARVVDCGQLITKSANDVLEGKRKRSSHSVDSQDSSPQFSSSANSGSESDEKKKPQKQKRQTKIKKSKRKRKETKTEPQSDAVTPLPHSPGPVDKELPEKEVEEEKEQGGKREKLVVRPEEIPPVPENRFLLRRDMPSKEDKTDVVVKEELSLSTEQKPAVSKSGRKIKGRGTIRYHTPTRSKSRSASVEERGSSETPPHWKEEMKRTKVYQPPSVERWNKGEKWDDRSDSAWSRSQCSSPHSSTRSSSHRAQRKEKKKAKRKKKSKKRKHVKKKSSRSKPPVPILSEGERSPSSERRSQFSRSQSRSTSSLAQRRRRTSPSYSNSRSHSRSYTSSRSRSRGKSWSYSRSKSYSRSRSRSYYRSRSRSRSRLRSKYRYRSPSSTRKMSRSPKRKKSSKTSHKPAETKVPSVSRSPKVSVPERAPIIPMSESPPPSRWKPGQKPWKPSYIHIQEIKAKVSSHRTPPPGKAGLDGTKSSQASAKQNNVLDESVLASKQAKRSLSRSSRSRSYSRSYSRSRSRSYSNSRSRSPHRLNSKSSSYSRSYSDNSETRSVKTKKPLPISIDNQENLSGYGTVKCSKLVNAGTEESLSESESRREKETFPVITPDKLNRPVKAERLKDKLEWDSDSDKQSQSNSATVPKPQEQTTLSIDQKSSSVTGWNSESDSENITKTAVAVSDKEEGEASSESDAEIGGKLNETVSTLGTKKVAEDSVKDEAPQKHRGRKKSKRKRKHKSKGQSKSSSHHSKSKKSKKKHQKQKTMFHWQPPLEFGEEEEEDDSKRERQSPSKGVKERPGPEEGREASMIRRPTQENSRARHGTVESAGKDAKQSGPHSLSQRSGHEGNLNIKQESDMDICTPEHENMVETPVACTSNNTNLSEPSQVSSVSNTACKNVPSVPMTTEVLGLRQEVEDVKPFGSAINFKWKPLEGMASLQMSAPSVTLKASQHELGQSSTAPQGVRMEIKTSSRVRPGSLFDEVRKTVRLNQRPRNQESTSGESSASMEKARSKSHTTSPRRSATRKSRSASSHKSRTRGWSHSSSRSRSRSSSYYSSRSRSRHRHGRGRSRSSTYRSYRSHSRTYSRSHSRSHSYSRHRRSRSVSSESYTSRSRSVSRRRGRQRSDSYRSSDRTSWSYHSSSRSSSRHRSRSHSSRYS
ncbi:NK-tumor recognition protein [Neosynchiropus ocellatus]